MFRILGLVITAVLLLVSGGCQKAAEEAVEKAVESKIASEGGQADVEINGESFSMQMNGQDGASQLNMGSGTKVPKKFPKDIPLYENMTVVVSHSQAQNQMFMVQGKSSDSVTKIIRYYREELPENGWQETNATALQKGKMESLGYEKEGRTLQVTATASEDVGTGLNITTQAK